jgi:hypothetical protein
MDNLKISVKDKILIIEDVTLKEATQLKYDFENSTLKYYPYLLYKSHLGYYAGWDFLEQKSIYCGTRSESTSLEQIKQYIKNNET